MSVPSNLIEALSAWMDATPEIADLYNGIYQGTAPSQDDEGDALGLPYLTFVQADSRVTNVIGRPSAPVYIEVAFESRAATAETARQLGEVVRDRILSGSPLSWLGGHECGRHQQGNEVGEQDEGMGPDGSDVWVHRIPITFLTSRW